MSTEVREIIVQAFRDGNFVAVGEGTTAEELLEAVPRLNNFISSLFGIELGEALREWYAPQSWNPAAPLRYPLTPDGSGATSADPWIYPPANVRLLVKIADPRTIYFPASPNDGARMAYADAGSTGALTLHGNGRMIEGAASLLMNPATMNGRKWLYRADLGNWIELRRLASMDAVPLPEEFDDLLVTGLIIRLASRYQTPADPTVIERHGDMLGRLKKRYKQSERMPSTMDLRSMFPEF